MVDVDCEKIHLSDLDTGPIQGGELDKARVLLALHRLHSLKDRTSGLDQRTLGELPEVVPFLELGLGDPRERSSLGLCDGLLSHGSHATPELEAPQPTLDCRADGARELVPGSIHSSNHRATVVASMDRLAIADVDCHMGSAAGVAVDKHIAGSDVTEVHSRTEAVVLPDAGSEVKASLIPASDESHSGEAVLHKICAVLSSAHLGERRIHDALSVLAHGRRAVALLLLGSRRFARRGYASLSSFSALSLRTLFRSNSLSFDSSPLLSLYSKSFLFDGLLGSDASFFDGPIPGGPSLSDLSSCSAHHIAGIEPFGLCTVGALDLL